MADVDAHDEDTKLLHIYHQIPNMLSLSDLYINPADFKSYLVFKESRCFSSRNTAAGALHPRFPRPRRGTVATQSAIRSTKVYRRSPHPASMDHFHDRHEKNHCTEGWHINSVAGNPSP